MAIDRVSKPKYIVGTSTGATFQGPWLNVNGLDNLSFHTQWTGTTAGTLTVEGSNAEDVMDVNTRLVTPSTRITPSTIATLAAGNPAGGAGQVIFPVTAVPTKWVRLVFTRSAGTGAMDCAFMGKGI